MKMREKKTESIKLVREDVAYFNLGNIKCRHKIFDARWIKAECPLLDTCPEASWVGKVLALHGSIPFVQSMVT